MSTELFSRRRFFKMAGAGAATVALSRLGLSQSRPQVNTYTTVRQYTPDIGIQLYTVRNEIEKDFDGTIAKIAAMGFVGVETYPLPAAISSKHAARVFKENGINVFGMHTELPVTEERAAIMEMSEEYQCPTVIYPGLPKGLSAQDPKLFLKTLKVLGSIEELKKRVALYNEIGEFFTSKNMHFGLHNHWWEFEKTEGVYPFYYFLEHLDKEIFFEIDTYWAKTAGRDPAKVVADFGKRAPFLHIKDGSATKDDKMFAHVPLGTGSMNIPTIAHAGGDNIQWMVVEFDEYAGNILTALQSSYSYLTQHGLARGRV